jgi:hypothetical protein
MHVLVVDEELSVLCRQKLSLHTHTHTHTHTWLAGVQHIGHILVVSIILEAQLLHTQVRTRQKQM